MTASSGHLDFDPYSFNAVSLFIIGLLSVIYLLRLQKKTAASWFLTAGLLGFTIGMAAMFFSTIILWGGVLVPLTDACAVISMAAMLGFSYHYPQKVHSCEASIARVFAVSVSLIAVGVSVSYAYQILKSRSFGATVPTFFLFLNPTMFLAALLVSIRRTFTLQKQKNPEMGWRNAMLAFYRPSHRQVRLLRNFSLALSLGLIQGIATGLEQAGLLHPLLGIYAINLSLLLMTVTIVYASFELTRQQPGLIIRLVGLSLVAILVILGTVGIVAANAATKWADAQSISHREATRQAISARAMTALPAEVVYVVVWPGGQPETPLNAARGQLLYRRQTDFDFQSLIAEEQQRLAKSLPVVTWEYFIEPPLRLSDRATPVILRYGANPPGSFHQYAGYTFNADGQTYEVGFSLGQMSRIPQSISLIMVYAVIGSSLFILAVFPRFFQTNLIRPLDRLLAGVRQADRGDLNISMPVVYEDEVGFLTVAFNKMAASLRDELTQRQHAEAELRQLADSLEQRVADRTRELNALYDVSTAASQARDSQTLLAESLARTTRALHRSAGFIALLDTANKSTPYQLAVDQGIPHDWQTQIKEMITAGELFETVSQQSEPILIANTTADQRVPRFLQTTPMTFLAAPLPAAGQVLGVIGVFRELGQSYNLDEIALLISIAGQVGSAVQTGRLRQRDAILEERQRLARDLHDSVTQSLYGLVALAEAGKIRVQDGRPEFIVPMIAKISKTARQAIREMRLFIHQLRPPVLEQEGLVNALDLRLMAVEGRSDLRARLQADADLRLPPPIETAFYQIAQESLNNSLKHAQAASVTVSLRQEDGRVILEIRDNGRGFDRSAVDIGGQGLKNMQTRTAAIGGELKIITTPGAGTVVRVSVDCLES